MERMETLAPRIWRRKKFGGRISGAGRKLAELEECADLEQPTGFVRIVGLTWCVDHQESNIYVRALVTE